MNITSFKIKSLLGLSAAPILFFFSLANEGIWAYAGLMFIPAAGLIDLFLPKWLDNPTKEQEAEMQSDRFFDILIWVISPFAVFCLGYFLYQVYTQHAETDLATMIGWTTTMGGMGGIWGIAVGHELGHRKNKWEVYLGKALLFISLRMTFMTFHNYGHHRHVGTPMDPTSAKRNDIVWFHMPVGLFLSWIEAWKIQLGILKNKKISFFSPKNNVFWYTVIQWSAIFLVLGIAGWETALAFVGAGLTGSLLFELINYVEHYGLRRKEIKEGIYERVMHHHSWNDDHSLSGSILLNGMRHSDHHQTYSRPYQLLRHFEEVPTNMPFNSGAMMVLALIPPLFFWLMNPKLDEIERQLAQREAASKSERPVPQSA